MPRSSNICTIPERWILDVTTILKRGDDIHEIEWTTRASREWEIFGRFAEAYAAMLKVLIPGVQGKKVTMPIDEGPTYSFFFYAKSEQMYGKICLRYDGKIVIIYSAHKAERDTL